MVSPIGQVALRRSNGRGWFGGRSPPRPPGGFWGHCWGSGEEIRPAGPSSGEEGNRGKGTPGKLRAVGAHLAAKSLCFRRTSVSARRFAIRQWRSTPYGEAATTR